MSEMSCEKADKKYCQPSIPKEKGLPSNHRSPKLNRLTSRSDDTKRVSRPPSAAERTRGKRVRWSDHLDSILGGNTRIVLTLHNSCLLPLMSVMLSS